MQLLAEINMDLHNNSQGRTGKTADELLLNGDLKMLEPGKYVPTYSTQIEKGRFIRKRKKNKRKEGELLCE